MIMQKIRKSLKNKKGFTLVELLVVIAVLGILAAIAVPRFADMRSKATVTRVQSELKQVQTALEMYYAENGEYPADGDVDDLSAALDSLIATDFMSEYTMTFTVDTDTDEYSIDVSFDGASYTVTRNSIQAN